MSAATTDTNASKVKAAGSSDPTEKKRKARPQRPFPACSFEEALDFAKAVSEFGSGQPVRRLSFFDYLGKSPESGPSRQLITNAGKYGLTAGSYQADQIELTAIGKLAVSDDVPSAQRLEARVKLAIGDIPPFAAVYDRFVGNKLPARAALSDAMREAGVPQEYLDEAVDTLSVNLRFVGLLQMLSGAERIVALDHALEGLPAAEAAFGKPVATVREGGALITHAKAQLETTCFYIAPIGGDGSELRKHSDLFLGSLVEPAIEPLSLRVVRADQIDQPGLISRQIMEYLLHARLVVADLSFHNPNVFYELAIRHATRLPVVQIIRLGDPLPFDVGQMRTVIVDTTDIFSFVPRIQTYVSEIASHARRALDDPDTNENPVSAYHPSFKLSNRE